ncbi:dTDP-4-dehydrorhamnose 3,5-epimerase [Hyphomicrobium nitrativorans NL23]|uniref:dTDP-4-dehydrorhamnose 3,5-epimerase n=1 Tax=Hyphomicrobium nitrativorans NL23 TaxID=1029756 RepID=V5SAP3_9HYPH|nr:dTDP-4-dehydrorhamnose 3,5-epimerase family protein [Hyphomicrobium nitrativorans]AHB47811.1 dTDP-4-dehydrorhamnose 3,5-epimerase [Hyphomicrobium nitrativorans NL23]
MKFIPTAIADAFEIEIDPRTDARGLFARTFCAETFAARGLASVYPHCNISHTAKRGTLRGLHYQDAPKRDAKLVRATRGTAFDVAVDLRPHSPTYLRWAAVELSAEKRNAFYIPAGCAHGCLSLTDECELFYQISEVYDPALDCGVAYDDPAFSIEWPFAPAFISERDATHARYIPAPRGTQP